MAQAVEDLAQQGAPAFEAAVPMLSQLRKAESASGGGTTDAGSNPSGPPAWARRMKQNQSMSRGAQTAAQVLKSGDSHGGGNSVDLSGGE